MAGGAFFSYLVHALANVKWCGKIDSDRPTQTDTRVQSNVKSDGGGWSKVGIINVGQQQRTGLVDGRTCMKLADFGMIFLNDGNSGEKSLQWDAIVGRRDGHTPNLGGVGRMAAEHRSVVAAMQRCDERVRRARKN